MSEKDEIILSEDADKIIDNEFKDFVKRFLNKKLRTGTEVESVYRSAIKRFVLFVRKSNVQDIDAADAEDYLADLDAAQKVNSMKYKLNQLYYLRAFFEYVKHHFESKRILYFNPIPSAKYFSFSPEKTMTIDEEEEKIKSDFYTIQELKTIMTKAYHANYELFIQIILLIFCGMRGIECVSILRVNVKIEQRFLMTGTEQNARKSNKTGKNGIFFCFPEEVADHLFDYMLYLDKKYPGSPWLFPVPSNPQEYTSLRTLQKNLTGLGFSGRTHKFRISLSTYRSEVKGEKTPDYIMEFLSNHKITSLEHRVYSKKPIEVRRKDYDRYFPTQYIELLSILSTFY